MSDFNPSAGADCSEFEVDKSYCVEYGELTATAASGTTPTALLSYHRRCSRTQPGQIANCNHWDLVNIGDTCDVFTAKYRGLTLAKLLE
ncbi:uncharacterized protein ATNIH1004_009750 [Aspergillus tanneri]|uniref:LysM domain-containing protein n=1 Tax=Aspergillus tanneri TaxID=1220188 RepID=A0A5M9M849_9EURO|nr:uncharacterized protein ATNIH1004_009750 [Aspergillus tanneri]KAA8642988.1 hypothetical protein ATNIH1004_009750 [Aspergillus tanneri]